MNSYVANLIPNKRRPRVTHRGGFAKIYTPAETVLEEKVIASVYKGELYTCPVRLIVHTYKALPKSRPKRIERERDTSTPDIDNIIKAIMDALNGVAYKDDRQVVEVHAIKHDKTRKAGDSIRFSVEPIADGDYL